MPASPLACACLVSALLSAAGTGPAAAQTSSTMTAAAAVSTDEVAIRNALASYNKALNAGDTAAVLLLYTEDGIFMAPYSPSNIGRAAIREAYDRVFEDLKFDVTFDIAELVQMAPAWAYVRTNSAGRTWHRSTGKTTSEANQELFIFAKADDGRWRIARYSFSPTNPPAH